MSEKTEKLFDVVLSHAPVDMSVADAVRRQFEAAGLSMFMLSGIGSDDDSAIAIHRAIQESVAFVILITPSHARSVMLPMEVGAAWMWSTPTYLLLSDVNTSDVPKYLERYQALPVWTGVQTVVDEVQKLAKTFSDSDREALIDAYQDVDVPADQLVATPGADIQLAKLYSARTNRSVSSPRLIRELLRLRKQGKLPRLTRKTAS